jgi:hypothetical protein
MGMGRVVLVQIAEASGLLCRAEASFQKSLGIKSNEDLTTRNEEYGLTRNNSCRPGAFAAWPKSFFVFGNGQRRDWHEQPPSLPFARQIKEITHAKRYGLQPNTRFRARN